VGLRDIHEVFVGFLYDNHRVGRPSIASALHPSLACSSSVFEFSPSWSRARTIDDSQCEQHL
jgi:hypothetical protein